METCRFFLPLLAWMVLYHRGTIAVERHPCRRYREIEIKLERGFRTTRCFSNRYIHEQQPWLQALLSAGKSKDSETRKIFLNIHTGHSYAI